jgi:hypothetical protein
MENPQTKICHGCQRLISINDNFCSVCGQAQKLQEVKISFSNVIVACVVSLFLPPFGLLYVFKYLRQESFQARKVAWLCAGLTLLSSAFIIYLFNSIMHSATQTFDSLNELMY